MSDLPVSMSLLSEWYREIEVPGVNSAEPGLYEWRIEGVGCYIGQYKRAKRPRREYRLNVVRILENRPYRKAKPKAFRQIHIELANAVKANPRPSITLTLLENQLEQADRNRRERELIKARRAEEAAGGLRVLNSI